MSFCCVRRRFFASKSAVSFLRMPERAGMPLSALRTLESLEHLLTRYEVCSLPNRRYSKVTPRNLWELLELMVSPSMSMEYDKGLTLFLVNITNEDFQTEIVSPIFARNL